MKSSPQDPLCRSCRYWSSRPYTHHATCSGGVHGLVRAVAAGKAPQFNDHGAAHGWAMWPWDFDPIWLEECELYESNVVAEAPGVIIYQSDYVPAGTRIGSVSIAPVDPEGRGSYQSPGWENESKIGFSRERRGLE